MSFWAGLARGYADADAKKEREAVRAEAEAARQEARDYARGRDGVMDARYDSEQDAAAAQAEEARNRWQMGFDQTAESLKADREWRAGEAERNQANQDRAFERQGKYSDREWGVTLDKWAFTKDQADEAKEHADRVFNQGIAAFEYGQSRDVVGDLRNDRAEVRAIAAELYAKERDLMTDAAAEQNRQDRLDQFQFQVTRAGVSDEQWQASFDLQADELEISRTNQILSMLPAELASTLGGGPASGDKGASNVMSVKAIDKGALAFNAEFGNLDSDLQKSEFFTAASESRTAQATIMAFMEAQAKKGNTVDLADVPKYFKYLGATEGKGEGEAKEFMASMLDGSADLKNKDTFINGLMAMRNYKPTQHLFMQTDVPDNIDDASKQITVWEQDVEFEAWQARESLDPAGADYKEVTHALALIKRKETRTEGLNILARRGFGADTVEKYGMADNTVISRAYGNQQPGAATPASTDAVNPPADATTFGDWGEVEAARAEGFSGAATVGGVSYTIAPVEVQQPVSADVDAEPPADTNDPEFLGTGYVDDTPAMDTPIDDMFNSVIESEGVPSTEIERYQRPPSEPIDMEAAGADIQASAEGMDIDAVIQDIEDIGIKWPINEEELGWFREDMKELVYGGGVDIPNEVLMEVIKLASENSLKWTPMQQQVDEEVGN